LGDRLYSFNQYDNNKKQVQKAALVADFLLSVSRPKGGFLFEKIRTNDTLKIEKLIGLLTRVFSI